MKITIEIDEAELTERVMSICAAQLAEELHKKWSAERYDFRKVVKAIMLDYVKENAAELMERCVAASTESITRRGVQKLLEQVKQT